MFVSKFSLLLLLMFIICIIVVNILRMIKMFGWESEISKRVAGRRDAELVWIKRKQLLDLMTNLLKCDFIFVILGVILSDYVSVLPSQL